MQALTEYWNNLPEEHKDTLFSMREEDFVAELDAHMKYQLKVPTFVPVVCSLTWLHGVMSSCSKQSMSSKDFHLTAIFWYRSARTAVAM